MSFPYLLARLGALRIEHLQLDERTTDTLRRRGALRISDLVGELGKECDPTEECVAAITALDRLAVVCGPRDVDWLTYWQGSGYQFHHRFLTCPELEDIDRDNPVCGISKANFGNAGVMLQRAGFTTLGDLVSGLREGLPDVPGMGAKKWSELFETLVRLVMELREGRVSKELLSAQFPIDGQPAVGNAQPPQSFSLGERTRSLHLGVLHLRKSSTLEAHGIRTVGEAADAFASLISLPGIGPTTIALLEARLELLAGSQMNNGDVDWERYCYGARIPLVPEAGDPSDGSAFVASLPSVLAEIGQKLDDSVLKLIIDRRLSCVPHLRATLEDVGSTDGVDLTRERVRQIESRFLKWMVAALLDDDYSNLDVHFRPSFASFWRSAADRFSESEEIGNSALLDGLAEVWQVDATLLADNLPFIITIMTGDVPTSKSLGDGSRLGKGLLNLPEASVALPMRRFQIGKAVRTLEAHGLDTLGKFVDAVRNGAVSRRSGSHFRSVIDHFSNLDGVFNEVTGVNWELYIAKTATVALPLDPTSDALKFLQSLVPVLTKLLEIGSPTNRSSIIFGRRTSHAVEARISTEALAKELGAHGPSIKREETELLTFLNEVLVGRNLAIASVHVRDDFLGMWKDVVECFEASDGDAESLKTDLSARWQIDSADVDHALPTLIAVLTGYPYKRLGRYTKLGATTPSAVLRLPPIEEENNQTPFRITLRGFRRHH